MEEIAERFRLSLGIHSNPCIDLVHNQLILDKLRSISSTKPVDKQSISNNEPDVTVICVDNSYYVDDYRGGGAHKTQAKAIALYSEEKLNAHPLNEVGLLAMGFVQGKCILKPTRDLPQIRLALKGLTYFGQSCIPIRQALTFFSTSNLPKRRLLVFFGGQLSLDCDDLESYAEQLKEFNVAVDVVNFGMQWLPPTKAKLLEAFVKAVNNDGNSHYLYAPSGSPTSLGQQILCSPLAPGGLAMQEEKKKEQELKKKEKMETSNDGFQTVSKKKKKGKYKYTNGSHVAGTTSVKRTVRFEPKAPRDNPKKVTTNGGPTLKSSTEVMNPSKTLNRENFTSPNPFSILNKVDEEEE